MRSRKKVIRKINIPMAIAALALCLVVFSMHFTSGLYARYTVKAGADDAARVAKFRVDLNFKTAESTADGAAGASTAAAGQLTADQNTAQIDIVNGSETAVRYTVVIEFANAASNRITEAKLVLGTGQNAETLNGTFSTDGKTLTFVQTNKTYTGALAPGAVAEAMLQLTILPSIEKHTLDFDNTITDEETANLPFVIRVSYVQID